MRGSNHAKQESSSETPNASGGSQQGFREEGRRPAVSREEVCGGRQEGQEDQEVIWHSLRVRAAKKLLQKSDG